MVDVSAQHSPKGFLQILFIIFIGLLLALFTGLGIAAFYPGPTAPTYQVPTSASQTPVDVSGPDTTYQQQMDTYDAKQKTYARNVAATSVVAAAIFLVLGLAVLAGVALIGDGFMLGGIFTLFYAIIRSSEAQSSRLEFAVVGISLLAVLAIAYLRFVRPNARQIDVQA